MVKRHVGLKRLFFFLCFVLAIVILLILLPARKSNAPAPLSHGPVSTKPTDQQAGFNSSHYPIDQAGSIWWVVSKVRPLEPADYAPDDLVTPDITLRKGQGDSEMRLRQEAATALEKLVSDAKTGGYSLMLTSGYRSYQLQVSVYNGFVQQYGQAGADKQSARPGTSEHQTGLAADVEPTNRACELEQCFGQLPEGIWLAAHAHEYGFVIRYPEGKQSVTGYMYEPWHIRYVGVELATEMHNKRVETLEEFFDIVPSSIPY